VLANRSSGLLPVQSQPAISNAPMLQLHRVSNRNASRNHEFDQQRCHCNLLRRKRLRNLGEQGLDFLLSERLRLQAFLIFFRQGDGLQSGKQVIEVLSAASAKKAADVLLGFLPGRGRLPLLVLTCPELDYVWRCDEGRKQLRPGRRELLKLIQLILELLDPSREMFSLFFATDECRNALGNRGLRAFDDDGLWRIAPV
jgi:hypothetical protein